MKLRSSTVVKSESKSDVKVHIPKLQMKPLLGSKPLYCRPEGIFVDHKKEECFIYWFDDSKGLWQISVCNLKSRRWKNLTVREWFGLSTPCLAYILSRR
jgi:hypothetical protein